MKTGPKKYGLEEENKILRKKVIRLERQNSIDNYKGRTPGYMANITLHMMCMFMEQEDNYDHRCYKNISLHEFRIFVESIREKEMYDLD